MHNLQFLQNFVVGNISDDDFNLWLAFHSWDSDEYLLAEAIENCLEGDLTNLKLRISAVV